MGAVIYIFFFPFSLFVSMYVCASVCDFVCIALLLPFVLGSVCQYFSFVLFCFILVYFLALVNIGGFVFWFGCSFFHSFFFLNFVLLKKIFNNFFLF